ncbi:MAG: YndJ family transporter [Haliscomenobacter sp.]|uniref:YndJ family transporter n=1 Tax=Haliscomenobacter sp. TaxID=2717303 RepID=UPI0029B9F89D|nr:YndJ family transporter [Haliscomenobacter sp.]MDX2069438.1 YndJ family transporter [Haliscomenobacter sp.]
MGKHVNNWEVISGGLGLGLYWVWKGSVQPLEKDWVELLVLLGAMVFVPMAMRLSGALNTKTGRWAVTLSTWALLLAYLQEPGIVAALLALPWVLVSIWLLGNAFQKLLLSTMTLTDKVQFAAYLYFPIGPLAAFSDRLDWAPLGFSSIIILLTAAHFHYAGFLLPWILANLLGRNTASFWQQGVAWAVLLGIPAVAVGITSAQFGVDPWLETFAATLMALGGLGVAVWHAGLALESGLPMYQKFAMLGLFLCLGTGMILALLYGWRSYFPLSFLSIPWMYALHGTMNTLGVGLFGILIYRKISADKH